MIRNVINTLKFIRATAVVAAGVPFLIAVSAYAQAPPPPPPGAGPGAAPAAAEVERVIVTGSNIPTAEETGPNPVDTYRPQDIEKLGVRNTTDLITKLPQEAGGFANTQQGGNPGAGVVVAGLRGLLPKETLVLIDGKRVAPTTSIGVDLNLTPFPMIDHIDILKDGASAVYGSDAVAGVINIFLVHKFRGLEIGGSIGNTNLGASNDMHEYEAWLKAGVGDDKTDIVVIADFYDRGSIFSVDRHISSNAFQKPFGGIDGRSSNRPGAVVNTFADPTTTTGFRTSTFRLFPNFQAPTPHSTANASTSPQYTRLNPYPDGNFSFFNFAAFTPAYPEADRQSFYGSFTRDLCEKYLVLFADFKYTRSFFNAALAPTPFTPDPFHNALGSGFSNTGISVPLSNAFNPFTVADATIPVGSQTSPGTAVTTGVKYRSLEVGNRVTPTTYHDILFDVGLRGEMGEFGDYFKTWNWEAGFRYSWTQSLVNSQNVVSQPGLRDALIDSNPATAFNPFLNYSGVQNQSAVARSRVFVTLHDSAQFEIPLGYLTFNGDLFNLPAGPVSFAIGGEYHGERFREDPDSLNTTFNTIGSTDLEASKVNRDVWGIYEEVRIPITSPTWNFPGAYSLEFDLQEREEWYSQNTAATTILGAQHSQYNAQKPKFSVRYQPLDPKYIGALTLRASYSEAFHAPTLFEISPASLQSFPAVTDPLSKGQTDVQIEERQIGNPQLKPEVAYEWTYGAVYSPKWIKGLTLSADWWHIDMRSLSALLGAQFIIDQNLEQFITRGPTAIPGALGPITLIIDPNDNLAGAVLEGLDYEAIYILESTVFGGPDWGRLTATVNGTWLSRFVLQVDPTQKPINIAGQFLPNGFTLVGSLPRNRAYFSLFYDGPADTWLGGFDIGATVHWTGQYSDDPSFVNDSAAPRKVNDWITVDLIASYAFNLPPPAPAEVPGFAKDGGKNVRMDGKEKNVMPVSTAEYNPCGWRAWLNGTTLTVGLQNVADEDPPFVAGSFESGFDESLADIKGRFWYVQLKKRF